MSNLAKPDALLADLRRLIDAAREHVAQTASSTLTMLYWEVGKRIRDDVLGNALAGYGEKIVATLSQELMPSYGRGFSRTALARMVQFAELFALESAGIRVAEYLARIPDMKLLRAQLHRAVEHARERAAQSLLADDKQADETKQGKA